MLANIPELQNQDIKIKAEAPEGRRSGGAAYQKGYCEIGELTPEKKCLCLLVYFHLSQQNKLLLLTTSITLLELKNRPVNGFVNDLFAPPQSKTFGLTVLYVPWPSIEQTMSCCLPSIL